jgi:hypothetical protein
MAKKDEMQINGDAAPFIEDDSLPAMDAAPLGNVMGEDAATGGNNLMTEPAPTGEEDLVSYGDMEPLSDPDPATGSDAESFAADRHGEGYLRLVVSVEGDRMTVSDASVVGGPLVEKPDLTGEMAYQALLDGRRIASEAMADLGKASSFAPPDEPEKGHHICEQESYDFVVRIPREEITAAQLGDLEIELLRPAKTTELSMETQPARGAPLETAAMDAGVEAPTMVARLSGVSLDALPTRAAEAVRKGLR